MPFLLIVGAIGFLVNGLMGACYAVIGTFTLGFIMYQVKY